MKFTLKNIGILIVACFILLIGVLHATQAIQRLLSKEGIATVFFSIGAVFFMTYGIWMLTDLFKKRFKALSFSIVLHGYQGFGYYGKSAENSSFLLTIGCITIFGTTTNLINVLGYLIDKHNKK